MLFSLDNAPKIQKLEYHSDNAIKADILNDSIEGFVKCSVKVPMEQRAKARNFPPVICKKIFRKEDLKGPALDLHQRYNYMPSKREYLIPTFEAEDVLFATPYIKWLVENFDCEVSNVSKIYQFKLTKPFDEVVTMCAEKRKNAPNKILGNIYKSLANCSFGKNQ